MFNPNQWFQMVADTYGGVPNTFIGGVASVINTPALLAAKLQNYPSGTAFSEFNIANFTIVGNDIKCYIGVDYQIKPDASGFRNVLALTYYYDYLSCKKIGNIAFFGDAGFIMNLKSVYFENVITIETNAFNQEGTNGKLEVAVFPNCINVNPVRTFVNQTLLERCVIPRATSIGNTALYDEVFMQCSNVLKVYANPIMQTNNSGGVEGDLTYVTATLGGSVVYVTNFTAPNPITNLSVGTVGTTTIQLNFTAPTGSTNAIDFYEAYANGIYKNKIVSGGNITGLITGTSYEIEVIPRDIYYNGSSSNKVTQSTI